MVIHQVHTHKKKDNILKRIEEMASKDVKKIIFPEGSEPRILKACSYLVKKKILEPILVGNEKEILKAILAGKHKELKDATIIDPQNRFSDLSKVLFELRKDKGMTYEYARELARDPVWCATLLLQNGEVDGLVCGTQHKTAETLKPAFQIIKTKPGVLLASSYFIMVEEGTVYFYADCAVNPNPNAEQLADIAITTADTAASFGYTPKVALLSFATHNSAQHELVEKVTKATAIAKERRPDLILDGPLQFDTAVVPDVAQKKAPQSPIQGDANILVFPNLDVGNIAYKITQRFGHAKPVGPILQGLNKPVNDLSIGCTVQEIIDTAALTAVQAQQLSSDR